MSGRGLYKDVCCPFSPSEWGWSGKGKEDAETLIQASGFLEVVLTLFNLCKLPVYWNEGRYI